MILWLCGQFVGQGGRDGASLVEGASFHKDPRRQETDRHRLAVQECTVGGNDRGAGLSGHQPRIRARYELDRCAVGTLRRQIGGCPPLENPDRIREAAFVHRQIAET